MVDLINYLLNNSWVLIVFCGILICCLYFYFDKLDKENDENK